MPHWMFKIGKVSIMEGYHLVHTRKCKFLKALEKLTVRLGKFQDQDIIHQVRYLAKIVDKF